MFSGNAVQLVAMKCTAQKMILSIKGFFSKCDQIRRKLQVWSYLLKRSLTESINLRWKQGRENVNALNFMLTKDPTKL